MKTIQKLLTTAGVALLAATAVAQMPYSSRDLLLVVRTDATGGRDLEANLGPVSQYINAGIASPGTPIPLSQMTPAQYSALTADAWTNLSWTVVGGDAFGDGNTAFPDRTLWLTRARQDLNTQSTPWVRKTSSSHAATLSIVLALGQNVKIWSAANPVDAITNSSQSVLIPTSEPASYSDLAGVNGDLNTTFAQGTVEAMFANGYAGATRADLYQVSPGTGPGLHLGYFELTATGTASFVPAPLTPSIVAQPSPALQTNHQGASVVLGVTASCPNPMSYQWQYNSAPIAGATSAQYTLANALPGQAGAYSVVVSSAFAAVTSSPVQMTILADTNMPGVTFSSPKDKVRTSNSTLALTGKATDKVRVVEVVCAVNGGAFQPVTLASNGPTVLWSTTVSLTPGTNVIVAKCRDLAGNWSKPAVLTTFFDVFTELSLTAAGTGSFIAAPTTLGTPTNGALLPIGFGYKVTAVPGHNHVFSNWSGSVSGTNPVLTFITQTNMTLVANFIPNPMLPIMGTYHGLFMNTNEGAMPSHQSSGFLKVTIKSNFTYSGTLMLDGDSLMIGGKFSIDAASTLTVSRAKYGKGNLTLHLDLYSGGRTDLLTGTIAGEGWTSSILADRQYYNATNNQATALQGLYTLLIPGFTNAAEGPAGYGWGTVSVISNGIVKLAGETADGRALSQGVPLSQNGVWPLYAQIYSAPEIFSYTNPATQVVTLKTNKNNRGSILGWVTFQTNASGLYRPVGTLDLIKTGWTNAQYAAGFTNTVDIYGSHYQVGATNKLPSMLYTNYSLTLTQGGLTAPIDPDIVTIGTKTTVTPTNHVVKITFTPKTGLFSGSFRNPDNSNLETKYKGAVLQHVDGSTTFGGGAFLGPVTGGKVLLTPNQAE